MTPQTKVRIRLKDDVYAIVEQQATARGLRVAEYIVLLIQEAKLIASENRTEETGVGRK